MDAALADACDLRLSIPGSGAVESLNVAAATPVLLAQWAAARRRMATQSGRETGKQPFSRFREKVAPSAGCGRGRRELPLSAVEPRGGKEGVGIGEAGWARG